MNSITDTYFYLKKQSICHHTWDTEKCQLPVFAFVITHK